jgi:hypothetical protein
MFARINSCDLEEADYSELYDVDLSFLVIAMSGVLGFLCPGALQCTVAPKPAYTCSSGFEE